MISSTAVPELKFQSSVEALVVLGRDLGLVPIENEVAMLLTDFVRWLDYYKVSAVGLRSCKFIRGLG